MPGRDSSHLTSVPRSSTTALPSLTIPLWKLQGQESVRSGHYHSHRVASRTSPANFLKAKKGRVKPSASQGVKKICPLLSQCWFIVIDDHIDCSVAVSSGSGHQSRTARASFPYLVANVTRRLCGVLGKYLSWTA